jgi:hypothetical protein
MNRFNLKALRGAVKPKQDPTPSMEGATSTSTDPENSYFAQRIEEIYEQGGKLVAVEKLNIIDQDKKTHVATEEFGNNFVNGHVGMEDVKIDSSKRQRACSGCGGGGGSAPHTLVIKDNVFYAYITGSCYDTIPYITHMLLQADETDKFVISINRPDLFEEEALELASAVEKSDAHVLVKLISTDTVYQFLPGLVADELLIYDGIFDFRQIGDFGMGSIDDIYTTAASAKRYSDIVYGQLVSMKILTEEEHTLIKTKAKLLALTGEEIKSRIGQTQAAPAAPQPTTAQGTQNV